MLKNKTAFLRFEVIIQAGVIVFYRNLIALRVCSKTVVGYHSEKKIHCSWKINKMLNVTDSSILHCMLPCIVIDFFLNNQPDALIRQTYSVIKLYMFGSSSLPIIRSFFTVHSALVSFMQVSDDRFQAESGWKWQFHPDSAWKWSS